MAEDPHDETPAAAPAAMQILQGTPASPGIVLGEVYVMNYYAGGVPRTAVAREEVKREVARFRQAIEEESAALERSSREMAASLGPLSKSIFEAYTFLLTDRALRLRIAELIRKRRVTAEYAVETALAHYIGRLSGVADPYFAGRAADLEDLSRRLLLRLQGKSDATTLGELTHPVILIAHDLSPLITATLDRSMILGFATEAGGRTSHAAIVARDFGIPAVVGVKELSRGVTRGAQVILDGYAGRVVVNPDETTRNLYRRIQEQARSFTSLLDSERHLAAETADGTPVEVLGNIDFPEEVRAVVDAGGAGVGLYRTEFLYLRLGRTPTERDHLAAYRKALSHLSGASPLVIRTLDLGMDKIPPDIIMPTREKNPFLGCRSIRLCQLRPAIFKTQLRAILRLSADHPVRCMLPLISTRAELRWAQQLIARTKQELARESLRFNPQLPVGIMIEVPSAALTADLLAEEADFFSIGTNDLIQYTLAVDRANESVAGLFLPAHPSVLRLIAGVIQAAREKKIPVGMCGEMAGEPLFVQLLLGMGLRSFSVAPSLIPEVKKIIRLARIPEAEQVAAEVRRLGDAVTISAYLREETNRILPGAVAEPSAAEAGALSETAAGSPGGAAGAGGAGDASFSLPPILRSSAVLRRLSAAQAAAAEKAERAEQSAAAEGEAPPPSARRRRISSPRGERDKG